MSRGLAFETWGGCLTRRDGAEDIAEHISATAVNDTNVLGEGEEGVRSQKQVQLPHFLHAREF